MSGRRLAVLPVALLVVWAAAGCGGDQGEEAEQGLPATWTIPDDLCARLDLVGVVTATVATPQQLPRAGTETVEADRAGCAAGAGSGFHLTVELWTHEEPSQHRSDLKTAQARLDPPSTWSSIGAVEGVPMADDVASWAESSQTAAYSVVALAADEDVDDALYLNEVVVADDNLVATVTVSSTSPRSTTTTPDETAAALAAAAAAVPEALGA